MQKMIHKIWLVLVWFVTLLSFVIFPIEVSAILTILAYSFTIVYIVLPDKEE